MACQISCKKYKYVFKHIYSNIHIYENIHVPDIYAELKYRKGKSDFKEIHYQQGMWGNRIDIKNK